MRWKKTITGDKRIITRFALFPIRVDNDIRWLEWCKIEQQAYDIGYYVFPWHNVRFIDKEKV